MRASFIRLFAFASGLLVSMACTKFGAGSGNRSLASLNDARAQAVMATLSPKLPSQFGNDRRTQPPAEIDAECEKKPISDDEILALVGSCRNGTAESCTRLARYQIQNNNAERAVALARRACDLRDPSGCAVLGIVYVELEQTAKAEKLLAPFCHENSVEGCSTLGAAFYKSGREQEATRMWERGCDKNDGTSCGNLGTLYFQEAQFEKALTFWRRGCSLDSCGACENLKVVRKNPAFPSEMRASLRN